MNKEYVLVIVSYGDGISPDGPGKRVQTARFRTEQAAAEAMDWLCEDKSITCRLYED